MLAYRIWGVALTVVCTILMFLPLISLIVLLIINSRATALLRESGYKVGLMGAKGEPVPGASPARDLPKFVPKNS